VNRDMAGQWTCKMESSLDQWWRTWQKNTRGKLKTAQSKQPRLSIHSQWELTH